MNIKLTKGIAAVIMAAAVLIPTSIAETADGIEAAGDIFATALSEKTEFTEQLQEALEEQLSEESEELPAIETEDEESGMLEAESGIEISTQYPAMTVKAGDSLTFDMDIENNSGSSKDLELSVVSIPDGWSGSFSASNKPISVVHVKNEEINSNVDFALDIPLETPDGDYSVELRAADGDATDSMTLRLKVSAEEIGESSFDAEYPSQEGDATTEFTFSASLINNTLSDQSYSFAANAPAGWSVSFLPSGETTKVAALDVTARTTQGVDISVAPPSEIEAGTYEIPCSATSASEKLNLTLSVTVKGSYDIKLSTPSGRLSFDAYAKQETPVQLTVTNTGNTPLTNINFSSSAPSSWSVRFETETIELLETGATIETTAYVTPGEDAMSGDYETDVTIKNADASDTVQFRVSVKTETKWGIIGIALIVVLAGAVLLIMRKFGRR